jgi:subtilisin family serine protease
MKRYIVDKRALGVLNIRTLDACEELGKDKVITDEPLEFSKLPFASIVLSDDQVTFLKSQGIPITEEVKKQNTILARDYEKDRSAFYQKVKQQALGGEGVKVGVLDSGCNTVVVPCEYTSNFADANAFADIFGHGTMTTSVIKHPIIGLAPNCILHHVKIINDAGTMDESAALAGLDYVLTNDLDVINLSWTYDTTNVRVAIASVIENNTVVIAASGNSNVETFTLLPAGLPNVVAVNSIAEDGSTIDFNIRPNPSVSGGHGITVACSGIACEVYDKSGNYTVSWGTSFSAPFFAGVFAIYKEQLQESNNKKVLDYILNRCLKTNYPNYFGLGTPSF